MLDLLTASDVASISLFTTTIDVSLGIPTANISQVFYLGNGFVRKFLKRKRKKKQAKQSCFLNMK